MDKKMTTGGMASRWLPLFLLGMSLGWSGCQSSPAPTSSAAPASAVPANVELLPDPAVTWGRLDNGLRYAVMPNAVPPGRITLRLRVASGSLNESENQRGLAHFLEHMAFNGSTHYESSTALITGLQRLGLRFGSDVNAHTSYQETVYKLDLPKNDPKLLAESLTLLRDYADGVLMRAEDIDKERGVVRSERRDKDGADFRLYEAGARFFYAGTIIPERTTIGLDSVIANAPYEAVRAYYRDFYSAERMVLVVTGDVKPAAIVPLLKEHFATVHTGSQPNKPLGAPVSGQGVRIAVCQEPEASETEVSMGIARPPETDPDSVAKRVRESRRRFVCWMLNRRFSDLCRQPGAKVAEIRCYDRDVFDALRITQVDVGCKQDRWQDALPVLEQEIRRACQYGFTEAEMATLRSATLNAADNAIRTAGARKSPDLAVAIYQSAAEQRVFTSPETDAALVRLALQGFDRAAALAEVRSMWNSPDQAWFVGGRVNIPGGEAEVRQALAQSQAVAVVAPEEKVVPPFAYASFGAPGLVAWHRRVEDLAYDEYRFANQVRLNVKRTDFEPGHVQVTLRFGTGRLGLPPDRCGLPLMAESVFIGGGLKAHGISEIRDIFAGRTLSSSFNVGEESFTLSGATNAEDLQTQLGLLCAYLRAPGFREEALRQFQAGLEPLYRDAQGDPMAIFKQAIFPYLLGSDPRWGLPPRRTMEKYGMEEVAAWLSPQLASGPLEISIVGDLEPAQAVAAVAATAGAMPARSDAVPLPDGCRRLKPPLAEGKRDFFYESQFPRGLVVVGWPVRRPFDPIAARRLGILERAFSDLLREEVREKAGAAYGPRAMLYYPETYEGGSWLLAMAQVDPARADEVVALMQGCGRQVFGQGISQDAFDRMANPQRNRVRDQRQTNDYWTGLLCEAQGRPDRVDRDRSIVSDYAAMTLAEVNDLAVRSFDAGQPFVIRLIPKKPAGATARNAAVPAAAPAFSPEEP